MLPWVLLTPLRQLINKRDKVMHMLKSDEPRASHCRQLRDLSPST
jgi:hypothetical protein